MAGIAVIALKSSAVWPVAPHRKKRGLLFPEAHTPALQRNLRPNWAANSGGEGNAGKETGDSSNFTTIFKKIVGLGVGAAKADTVRPGAKPGTRGKTSINSFYQALES